MKILILYESMVCGGIEKSIINFLKSNDYSKNEVDLYLNRPIGEFYDSIPRQVNILNVTTAQNMNQEEDITKLRRTKIKKFVKMLADNRILKWFKAEKLYYKMKYRNLQFKKKYDIAIVHNIYFNLFYLLANKVNANYKCAIFHGDYAFLKKSLQKYAIKEYKNLDTLYFVSKSCEMRFHALYKKSGVNTDFVYNMQDTNEIIEKAKLYDVRYGDKFNIVSVSRLSEEKAHLRTLSVFKSLHDEGLDFCWHVVGEGPMRSKIEEFIANNNMSDYIKLYGNQNNPYPYIKAADLFYLGSYHEAAPMVYAEAMSLGVPVLTTETCSARELVGEYGIVCGNNDEDIYSSFKIILQNNEILNQKRELLKMYRYNNSLFFDKITQEVAKKN